MVQYARPVGLLMEQLQRLPGIGPKSAQRLAFAILSWSPQEASRLSSAIGELHSRIRECSQCYNFTEEPQCPICRDVRRDPSAICVVAEVRDLMAVESSGTFRGLYHVLHGLLSPMEGIGPDRLRVKELLTRIDSGGVQEVILATNPTVEGDTTAMYIAQQVRPKGVRVTQLALGLPVGGDLDYADQVTIARALEGRRLI